MALFHCSTSVLSLSAVGGLGCSVSTADSDGNTPMHYAAGVVGMQLASLELGLRLVLAGASLSVVNSDGKHTTSI